MMRLREDRRVVGPSRRGGVAVALVVALVILQLIVVGMVVAGSRDQALSVHRAESLRALYAAEAGLGMSARELALGEDEDGDGTVGSISADGSAATGPVLLGSRISSELRPIDSTSGEIVSGARATQASRQIRAAYHIPTSSGGSGGAGLAAQFFALASAPSNLASVNWSAAPSATGPVPYVYFLNAADASNPFWNSGPMTRYGVRLTGLIEVPQSGLWTFRLGSDDGSRLLINGEQVINHDGTHSYSTRNGSVNLTAGRHAIEILFFENGGNHALTLAWQGPGVPTMSPVPPSAFSLDVPPSPEFPPIALSGTLHVWGDNSATAAFIDAFDASAGMYGGANVLGDRLVVATNSTASQCVQMSSRASIRGSLQIGPGGNPASAVALWGNSQVTGGVSARSTAVGVHRIIDPYVTMPASQGSQTFTSSFTINSNRTYQDLSVWGNNTVVTIVGDVVIRCTGNFSIGDRVAFQLAAGATLTLYVGGDVNIYNRATINMNTGDPSRCWLFMYGADRRLQLTERAKLVAHVRNPKGSMELWGNSDPGSELFGTFHGRNVTMGDKTRIHADISLLRSGSGGGGGSGEGVTITAWSQEP